jgi:holliday junction DNA helicase RuvA
MIVAIRGRLVAKTLDSVLVWVDGLTLQLFAPRRTVAELPVGAPVDLHTTFLVREDALTLYGFQQVEERDLFDLLLTVGGVGPRLGLGLLSSLSAQALREAVVNEDLDRLTLAPGVGRRVAARLVLELRPRFEKLGIAANRASVGSGGNSPGSAAGSYGGRRKLDPR